MTTNFLQSKHFIALAEKLKQEHLQRVDEMLTQATVSTATSLTVKLANVISHHIEEEGAHSDLSFICSHAVETSTAVLDAVRNWLELHHSVDTYFKGDGPVGRYLKRRLLEARIFESNNAELQQQADLIEDALLRLVLPVKRDREEAHRFIQKLLEIYQQIYSPQEALGLLPKHLRFSSKPHLDEKAANKVYEQVAQHGVFSYKNQDPKNGLALRLAYPFAHILVVFSRSEFFTVYWYHAAENTWLAWDGVTVFEDMTDQLEREWKTCQSILGTKLPSKEEVVIHERVDWTHEQILKMVEMVFSADQYLEMTDDPCYTREADACSRLAFEYDNYQWIFLDTRGAWPSRTDVLTRKTLDSAAGIGHSVKWESLSEQTKQGLYNAAGNACSRLQMLIASRMEIQLGKVADEHQRTL